MEPWNPGALGLLACQSRDIVQQQYRSSGIVGIDSGNFLWCDKRSSRDNVLKLAQANFCTISSPYSLLYSGLT